MPVERNIFIIGGDRRTTYLYDMLCAQNYGPIYTYGLPRGNMPEDTWQHSAVQADLIILPVPAMRRGSIPMAGNGMPELTVENVLSCIRPDCPVIGGFLAPQEDARIINLLHNEEFLQDNAETTAEGALCIALQHGVKRLKGNRCMVVGYGRIGRQLVRLLNAFGCEVWATARRDEALEEIRHAGAHALHILQMEQQLGGIDILFNTVPERVLDESALHLLKRDAIVLELASEPYGVDIEAAHRLMLDAGIYGGIPGKLFPRTAAEVIFKQIVRLLEG